LVGLQARFGNAVQLGQVLVHGFDIGLDQSIETVEALELLAGQGRGHVFDTVSNVDDRCAAAPIEVFLACDVIEIGPTAGPD
jgi:hypothetical protein